MRIIPILAAATIGLFATSALGQSTNTADPNSAPKASATGGKPMAPAKGEVKKMDTTDPNSAAKGSATGGKAMPASAAEVKKMDTSDPNSTPASAKMMKKKHAKKKSSAM